MAGVDLDFIKQEIDKSKKEKKQQAVSEGVDVPMARDEFLYGLKQAIETGRPNTATAKLGVVAERSENMVVDGGQVVANKNTQPINEVVHQKVNSVQQPQQPTNQPQQKYNQPDPNAVDPRDAQFNKNLAESKQILGNANNVGLGDAISQYTNMGSTRNPQPAPTSNPNYLIEQVNNAVQTYFQTSNVVSIIEQAVKNTMMEIYEKEKLASALNENKDMIQKIVVDTILNLKKRNSQKK